MPKTKRNKFFGVNYRDSMRCDDSLDCLEARELSNVRIIPGIGLIPRKGRQTKATLSALANTQDYFTDYQNIKHLLIAEFDKIYDYGDLTGTGTLSYNGVAPDVKSYNCSFSDFFWYANGTDNLKFDGTNWSTIGIERPVAAPTVTSGGAGVLTGEYQYAYNYYYENLSLQYESESSISDITSIVVTTKENIISGVADPSGYASGIRLWRRSSTAVMFQLLVDLPNANFTYTDNTIDDNLGDYIDSPYEGAPDEKLTGVINWKNRLFGWSGSRLHMTKEEMPEKWYGSRSDYKPWTVDLENNESIINCIAIENILLILTSNKGYCLIGDSENNFTLTNKLQIGIIAPRTLISCGPSLVAWLSKGGVYTWNFVGTPECISEKINTDYHGFGRGLLDAGTGLLQGACSIYNPDDQTMWISVSTGGGSINSKTFVYHFEIENKRGLSCWSVLNFGFTDAAQTEDKTLITIDPLIAKYSLERIGNKDDTTNIDAEYYFRYYNFGTDEHDKRILRVAAFGHPVDNIIRFYTTVEYYNGDTYTDYFDLGVPVGSVFDVAVFDTDKWAGTTPSSRSLPMPQECVGNFISFGITMKNDSIFVSSTIEYSFEGRSDQ